MINPGSVSVALLALLALLIAPVNSPTVGARDSDRGVPVTVTGGSGCTMYYTDGDPLPDGLTCNGALLCLPGSCEKNDAEPGQSYRICSCQ